MFEKPLSEYRIKHTPSYSVLYKHRHHRTNRDANINPYEAQTKTTAQVANEENLKNNCTSGYLSHKSSKAIKEAINWLDASAIWKTCKLEKSGKKFQFRVNFITLTLPTSQDEISDQQIKKDLLHPFLAILKLRFDFFNYVWKAEAQSNGNIHFHIVSDCFIPHDVLRFLWNRLLIKKNYMQAYTHKYAQMSLGEYAKEVNRICKTEFSVIKKRFIFGKSTKWENPNSTDIHSCKDVDNVGAYVASYMGKKDADKRPITGRLWSCSYSLSKKNKCTSEFLEYELDEVCEKLENLSSKVFCVCTDEDSEVPGMLLATIFYHKPSALQIIDDEQIKGLYTNHLASIRQGPQIDIFSNN